MAMMDTIIQATRQRINDNIIVPCKVGCAHCCSRYSKISVAEATLIYEYLKKNETWTGVRGRARAQFQIIRQTEPLSWFKLNIKCPILNPETNKCLAYKIRPPLCAIHFVTSSPDICDPWSSQQGKFVLHDYTSLYLKFRERLFASLEGHGIFSLELPIPTALLLSERISVKSGLDVHQALTFIYNEL